MGKHRNRKVDPEAAAYKVGYGKPPRDKQFQNGHTRNKGRLPKSPAKAPKDLLHFLEEVVSVPQKDGTLLKLSRREMGHRNLANKFAMGDLRAIRVVVEYEQRKAKGEESDPLLFDPQLRKELLKAIEDEIRTGLERGERASGEGDEDDG